LTTITAELVFSIYLFSAISTIRHFITSLFQCYSDYATQNLDEQHYLVAEKSAAFEDIYAKDLEVFELIRYFKV
jgi:hypothetical protein